MKNLPEKIYLNFDFEPDQSDDFNDLKEVTHSSERVFKQDIEYVRKDVAEQMAKDCREYFLGYISGLIQLKGQNKTLEFINNHEKINKLFIEFLNSLGK